MRKEPSKKKQENIWQIQEAKAKFSKVLEEASRNVQIITKNGAPVAVILSKEQFDKMSKPTVSFLDFFKSAPYPDLELNIKRSKDLAREIDL